MGCTTVQTAQYMVALLCEGCDLAETPNRAMPCGRSDKKNCSPKRRLWRLLMLINGMLSIPMQDSAMTITQYH